MQFNSSLKRGLLNLVLFATILGCTNTDKQSLSKDINARKLETSLEINNNEEKAIKSAWENISEYDSFIRSKINEYYSEDVNDIYSFYNIKRDLPKYGFKSKKNQNTLFDCTGAVYKEKKDSIYFYSTCLEELFNKYSIYSNKNYENAKEDLSYKLHYYIKHEAGHAFYYDLGKQLGEDYLFQVNYDNTSALYNIQHSLIEEGVADYIAYKGKLNPPAERLNDEDFDKMIKEKNDFNLYYLGFKLVKPILDIDFEKGIIELIKNPLTKEDLNDLLGYREKRIEKISKELQK